MDAIVGIGDLLAIEPIGRKTGTLILTASKARQQEN
jgi:hypothetical protein